MERLTLIAIILVAIVVGCVLMYTAITTFTPRLVRYIAIIKLRGQIAYAPMFFDGSVINPDDVRELANRVINDPTIRAVVVVINSPGGSATASEEIYRLMMKLAERKVVVVYAEDVMASGGYYIALPAHKIIASPHTIVGSVGAIATVININKLLEKLGVNVTIVKAGKYKDILTPFRNMTKDEYEILKNITNDVAEVFKNRVLAHRPNVNPEVFTAKIYIASDALRVGLIDGIGSLDDAIEEARKLANLPLGTPVIEVEKPKGLLEILLGQSLTSCKYTNPLPDKPVELLMMWIPELSIMRNNVTIIESG